MTQSTDADVPGTTGTATQSPAAERTTARTPWIVAAVCAALAVVGLVAATLFGLQAAELRGRAADRADAQARAEVIAAQVTTFEGETIDEWLETTQAVSTGDFAQELTGMFDQSFRQALRDNEAETVGEVLTSFVQELDGDTATVFVVVRQTSRNRSSEQPVQDELRMEVELRRVEGEWKASDVAVLGPAGTVPGAAGNAGGAEEDG